MSTDEPEDGKTSEPSRKTGTNLKKVLAGGVGGIVLILLVVLLSLDLMIKSGVELGVRRSLGLELKIDNLDVSLLDTAIRIEGMTLGNPDGFEGESLAKIPLIHVDYELGPLFSNKMHCSVIELNVEEVAVIMNKNGEVNLNRLKAIIDEMCNEQPGTKSEEKPKEEAAYEIKVDKLYLTLGSVRFMDLAKGKERNFDLGLNREEFTDLQSVEEIVKVVVVRTVTAAGLANTGVAVDKLTGGLKNVGGKGMETIKSAGEALKSIRAKVEETGSKLKETGSKLKEKTKGFFKKLKDKDE